MSVRCDFSSEIPVNLFKPDIIVHCAGLQPYSSPWFEIGGEPSMWEYLRSNVYATQNIINFAEQTGCKRIINLSTIGVYGQIKDSIMDEGTPRVNVDDYGNTKYVSERLLKESTVAAVSLRVPGIIGKRTRGIWVARTVEKLKKDEMVEIYSPDFVTRNFVWIDDLAKFVITLINQDCWKYEEIVLGCKKGEKIKDIVECMKRETGSKSSLVVKQGERKSFCIHADRAFEMGYESLTPLEIMHEYCAQLD